MNARAGGWLERSRAESVEEAFATHADLHRAAIYVEPSAPLPRRYLLGILSRIDEHPTSPGGLDAILASCRRLSLDGRGLDEVYGVIWRPHRFIVFQGHLEVENDLHMPWWEHLFRSCA